MNTPADKVSLSYELCLVMSNRTDKVSLRCEFYM